MSKLLRELMPVDLSAFEVSQEGIIDKIKDFFSGKSSPVDKMKLTQTEDGYVLSSEKNDFPPSYYLPLLKSCKYFPIDSIKKKYRILITDEKTTMQICDMILNCYNITDKTFHDLSGKSDIDGKDIFAEANDKVKAYLKNNDKLAKIARSYHFEEDGDDIIYDSGVHEVSLSYLHDKDDISTLKSTFKHYHNRVSSYINKLKSSPYYVSYTPHPYTDETVIKLILELYRVEDTSDEYSLACLGFVGFTNSLQRALAEIECFLKLLDKIKL